MEKVRALQRNRYWHDADIPWKALSSDTRFQGIRLDNNEARVIRLRKGEWPLEGCRKHDAEATMHLKTPLTLGQPGSSFTSRTLIVDSIWISLEATFHHPLRLGPSANAVER